MLWHIAANDPLKNFVAIRFTHGRIAMGADDCMDFPFRAAGKDSRVWDKISAWKRGL
jgi:hypothetical protein